MKLRHNILIPLLVAAAGLLVAGCRKQNIDDDGTSFPLSFEVDIDNPGSDMRNAGATKADHRMSKGDPIDNFTVAGYTGATTWLDEQTVSTSSSMEISERWMIGDEHTFFAYANMPASGATAAIASDGVTLTYSSVPKDQDNQRDIMLGYYKGKGDNGKAKIKFYHPLAAVQFVCGTFSGVDKVTRITIDGVYASGSVKMGEVSGTPTFSWDASGTLNGVNQTVNVTSLTKKTKLGDPFILIPQPFSSKAITLKFDITTSDGRNLEISGTINSGTIAAGKLTTYEVSFDAFKGRLVFGTPTVTPWGSAESIALSLKEVESVVIAGRRWATKNLGATTVAGSLETCSGGFYEWGYNRQIYNQIHWSERSGYNVPMTFKPEYQGGFCWMSYCGSSSFVEFPTKPYDNNYNMKPEYDAVTIELGDGWRIPTHDDFLALRHACGSAVDKGTDPGPSTSVGRGMYWCNNYDGVKGVLFCDGVEKVFFPAAGVANQRLKNSNQRLYYWSSTIISNDTDSAYNVNMSGEGDTWEDENYHCDRYNGCSLRPVKDV